jgi:hypothetical protein
MQYKHSFRIKRIYDSLENIRTGSKIRKIEEDGYEKIGASQLPSPAVQVGQTEVPGRL